MLAVASAGVRPKLRKDSLGGAPDFESDLLRSTST